jgi:hypothetical protein
VDEATETTSGWREVSVSYEHGPWNFGVSILEFRGDKIA